jgi:D-lactate dehydrogenase
MNRPMKVGFVSTEAHEQAFFKLQLPEHELEFADLIGKVSADIEILSVFIYDKIDRSFLDAHRAIRLICTRSTGFDHIDLGACAERGILVSNVPSYGESTVAEHTLALILMLSRRIRESILAGQDPKFSMAAIRGFDLKGKTLGVVGTGRIGLHVIRLACAFGMEVRAFDVAPQLHLCDLLGFRYTTMECLLEQCLILSLHCPLHPENYHLLNRDAFAKCRKGVIIINTARGSLIDTGALLEALDAGIVAGAGLDVLEDELATLRRSPEELKKQINQEAHQSPEEDRLREPQKIRELQALAQNKALIERANVIFTPHVAFNSVEALRRINVTTSMNIQTFVNGSPSNLIQH